MDADYVCPLCLLTIANFFQYFATVIILNSFMLILILLSCELTTLLFYLCIIVDSNISKEVSILKGIKETNGGFNIED